jgi:hypothetical protein
LIPQAAGLHCRMLAGALAAAGLMLPAASAHATSAHTTRAGATSGPAPSWSFSISGANGAAYLHAGNR